MPRKKRLIVGAIIVILAIGFLGYGSLKGSVTYYYTVSELKDLGSSIQGQNLRVNGRVALGSVEHEPGSLTLGFRIAQEEDSLPVLYQGIIPDAFKAGNDIVVEGHLDSDDVFQAHTLLLKCPSKYEPKN